jgi:ankyrin repeat protein
VRLFYSQRLGKYCEPDPPFLSKQTGIAVVPILILNATYLSAWILLTAYLKGYVFLCVGLTFATVHICLQVFIFRLDTSQKIFDAMLNGVPKERRETETRKIYLTAILTSWVSPYTVWWNNKPTESCNRKLERKNSSKYFLFASNAACSLSLVCFLLVCSYSFVNDEFDFDRSKDVPLTHCFRQLQNGSELYCSGFQSCFSFDSFDSFEVFNFTLIRVCEENENPTDLLRRIAAPTLIVFLFLNIVLSTVLQFLGSYENMFQITMGKIIHPTVIFDFLEEIFEKSIRFADNTIPTKRSKFKSLLSIVTRETLNQQNPLTGNTSLFEAFNKSLDDEVNLMLQRGANPKVKNKLGESVEFFQTRNHIEEFSEKKQTWKNETFVFEVVKKDKKCKILLRDEDKSHGKIYWNLDFEESQDINSVLAFGTEACKMLEMSEKIGSEKSISKMLSNLAIYAKKQLQEKANRETEKSKSKQAEPKNQEPKKLTRTTKSIESIFRGITSFIVKCQKYLRPKYFNLHDCVEHHNCSLFYLFHFFLGANLHAKNSDQITPLKKALKEKIDLSNHLGFYWYVLQLGAAAHATSDEEKDLILEIIDLKLKTSNIQRCVWCRWFQLKLFCCSCDLPKDSLTNIFFRAVYRLCQGKDEIKMKRCIKYLLYIGCNFNCINENNDTVFHTISNLEKFKELQKLINEEYLEIVNQPNAIHKMPLHLAVQNKNNNFVKFLIFVNADLNVRDKNLKTPLHFAVTIKHSVCLGLLLKQVAKQFVDAQDSEMKSPLHLAAKTGNIDAVKKLIEKGANTNLFDAKLNTPLHYAAQNGSLQCVEALIKSGAKINAKNVDFESPYQMAKGQPLQSVLFHMPSKQKTKKPKKGKSFPKNNKQTKLSKYY